MKYAIYARISTEKQEKLSFTEQLKFLFARHERQMRSDAIKRGLKLKKVK